jgi:dolichol-phosphate mannosyltransferase
VFAVIGGLGAIANVGIVWALTALGMNYVVAAIIAAEVTIIGNFLLIERFVFQDMRAEASNVWSRFAKSFTFNNIELVVRIPVMAFMVADWNFTAVLATAVTLAIAFVVRFVFHSLVVYAPRKARRTAIRAIVDELDTQAVTPGEL